MSTTFITTIIALLSVAIASPAHARGAPFNSQLSIHGRLASLDPNIPTPNGLHDFNYEVCDQNGNVLATAQSANVDVLSGGTFFDAPDFGSEVFAGNEPRFVKVSIRPSGTGDPFIDFQKIEIKNHPRAQFAGEIFLPYDGTVVVNAGTSAITVTNGGTGGTADFSNTNSTRTDPVVSITSAGPSDVDALNVNGGSTFLGTLKAGPDPQFAIFVVDQFGVLVDSNLAVTGKATFDGGININGPSDFFDYVTMTSDHPINQVLATTVIENTDPTGRALLAFNQNGGQGGFFSSIGGIGAVGDGTGPTSIAVLALTNNGRAFVAQNNVTSSSNPLAQLVNVGMAPAMTVQNANPATTATPVIVLDTVSAGHQGLLNEGRTALLGNVSIGGAVASSNPIQHVPSGANLSIGGTWVNASSRDLKQDFEPVNPRDVLEKVARLPVTSWRYRIEPTSVRHMGPTAEDFAATFELGEGNRTIASVDGNGVALAAIQGLHQIVREQEARIGELQDRLARLEDSLERLEHDHRDR